VIESAEIGEMTLLILGIVLVIFGGVVLIYFPDRSGGEIEWFGVKVRSAAAGLPLIVLGTIAVVLAVSNWQSSGPRPPVATAPGLPEKESEPEKTAHALLTAWIASDRNTALKLAEPAAVDKLFSGPSLKVNAKELACHPVGTGQRDCQITHTKGIMVFRLRETNQGWWVENVEY
jgi:hypothetical protein